MHGPAALLGSTRRESARRETPLHGRGPRGDTSLTRLHQGLLLLHHVGAEIEVVVVDPIQALGEGRGA